MFWRRRRLESFLDFDSVRTAIEEAEKLTSGEIRVSIAPFFWGSVERAAERAFDRLGMSKTKARNGVLIFIVPARRSFVIRGDQGIHDRVGQQFWDDVIGVMTPHFRRGDFNAGVLAGIAEVARVLARHFPYDPDSDEDELPDTVDVAPG